MARATSATKIITAIAHEGATIEKEKGEKEKEREKEREREREGDRDREVDR